MKLIASIKQWDRLRLSPAWKFVTEACEELDNAGFVEQGTAEPPHPDDEALIALRHDGLVLGFLSYRYDDRWSNWWITMAWVQKRFRQNGIHTALFKALVERAKAHGDITSIESGTHKDNVVAQKAFENQGRKLVVLGYSYPIRDHVEGKDYLEVGEGNE